MTNYLGNLWFVVQESKMGRVSNYTSYPKCVWGRGIKEELYYQVTMARSYHGMKCAHCQLAYTVKGANF